jgi:hypothetical protein
MTFSILSTLECANLSLTFYAPNQSNKNVSCRTPSNVKKSRNPLSSPFDKRGKEGDLRNLGGLCVPSALLRGMLCARHVLKIRFLNEGSEGMKEW